MNHVDVKKLRERLGLSQSEFCEAFDFPLTTLQNWEQDLRSPSGPARVLLMVISHSPGVVLEALLKEGTGDGEARRIVLETIKNAGAEAIPH